MPMVAMSGDEEEKEVCFEHGEMHRAMAGYKSRLSLHAGVHLLETAFERTRVEPLQPIGVFPGLDHREI